MPPPRDAEDRVAADILDGVSVVAYRLDALNDYRLTHIAGSVRGLTGYDADDFLADAGFAISRTHVDDRAAVEGRVAALASSGRASLEYRFQRPDDTYVWVPDEARLIREPDGGQDYAVGTLSDITEAVEGRRRAEADAAKLSGIVGAATSAIVVTGARGEIESFNRAAEEMFGYAESDMIGRSVGALMPVADAHDHGRHMGRYTADGAPRVIGTEREVRGQRSDGSTFPMQLALSEAHYGGGLHFCGILSDVTETRELEAELRALNADLEQRVEERTAHLEREIAERQKAQDELGVAQEERQLLLSRILDLQDRERAHISYELHDHVGQQLASLMVGLRVLSIADTPEGLQEHADELRAAVGATLEHVRSLAVDTRSSSLDDMGLTATLRTELSAIQERAGVQVTFDAHGCDDPRLPPSTELSLHRIVQSALANVTQHARAANVGVYIQRAGDTVSAVIEDDGIGFDIEAVMAGPVDSRFGLLAMQERARANDGEVSVDSTPGHGCTVLISLPAGTREES